MDSWILEKSRWWSCGYLRPYCGGWNVSDRISKDLKLEQLTERTLVLLTELKGMITGKKLG
jgi:hypothetical protein